MMRLLPCSVCGCYSKDSLNKSSLIQSTKTQNAILGFSHIFNGLQPLKMAAPPCAAEPDTFAGKY